MAAGANSKITLGNGTDTVKAIGSLIHAGNGQDSFVFTGIFGQSTVTNFNLQNDIIQLDRSQFGNFAAVQAHMSQHGADTIISDALGDTIPLVGVSIAQFQAHQSDFHLV